MKETQYDVTHHEDVLDEYSMGFMGHDVGMHDDFDEDDIREAGVDVFLLTNSVEDGEFWYDPLPDILQEVLLAGTCVCAIFRIGG